MFFAPSSSYDGVLIAATEVTVQEEVNEWAEGEPLEPHTPGLPLRHHWSVAVDVREDELEVHPTRGDVELARRHIHAPTAGTWRLDRCCLGEAIQQP